MTEPIDTAALRREAEEALELARPLGDAVWKANFGVHGDPKVAQWPNPFDIVAVVDSSPDDYARARARARAIFIADACTRVPSLAENLIAACDEIDSLKELGDEMSKAVGPLLIWIANQQAHNRMPSEFTRYFNAASAWQQHFWDMEGR